MFLDEFASATWDEELSCYLCTVNVGTEEAARESSVEKPAGSLGGVSVELGEEFNADSVWPGEAGLLGDFACLETPKPKKAFRWDNPELEAAKRAEAEKLKRDFGPKISSTSCSSSGTSQNSESQESDSSRKSGPTFQFGNWMSDPVNVPVFPRQP